MNVEVESAAFGLAVGFVMITWMFMWLMSAWAEGEFESDRKLATGKRLQPVLSGLQCNDPPLR